MFNIDNNTIINLNNKFKEIKKLGWVKGNKNNSGSAGIIFEELLGNTFSNFELPDYQGIEIKTKSSTKEKRITLFSATPDSFLFEIKRIVETYGYPDKDFPQYNILNINTNSRKYSKTHSNFYFKLKVDYNTRNVILEVYDNNFKLIDTNTKWSFDLLKEKLERKLGTLAMVKVNRCFSHNELLFKYERIDFYKLRNFETFIELIKKGIIQVTFRIGIYKNNKKIGQIYDHGSSFDIKIEHLDKLFQKVSLNNANEII